MTAQKINNQQIDIKDIELSEEQKIIYNSLESTNTNYFVTGKAGTGKSVLLQYFKSNSEKKLVVVAPTGVAALNVGGQTIHSLFKIPPNFVQKEDLQVDPRVKLLLRNIETVIIDEISMVRADLMDAIDYILRKARANNSPFGGVQIIMFGDLYQLPPVVSDPELINYFFENYGGFYFFNAHVWQETSLEIYELNYIFRQKEESFRQILNSIRVGEVDEDLLDLLNQRAKISIPLDGVVTLGTTNQSVSEINSNRLNKLDNNLFEYFADISGNLEKSSFPTDEVLQLKKGAQVMMIKNDKEKRWVNGTVGVISDLSEDEIEVSIDGIKHPVPLETWNKVSFYYNREKRKVVEEIVSSFTQFPLRLAWAVTIHKSQGQTYSSVVIDMGTGAFAHGQTYVALSRCKTLDGLFLKRPILERDIIVDPKILDFMKM